MHTDNNSPNDIKVIEKKTFRLHMIAQVFSGISFGILMLQEVILKKSLSGSNFEVTVLIFLTSSAFLFSIYGPEIINRQTNQGKTIILLSVFSRSFLLIIPLFETPVFFILCIAACNYTDSLIRPAWNTVFKHNYTNEKRSTLYSYASSLQTIVVLVVTTLSGYLFDFNYKIYKILYPAAGIFDILAYINLAKMITWGNPVKEKTKTDLKNLFSLNLLKDIIILPVRNLLRIFRENKPFRRFENYFFLYGVAFMIASPAVPIFLVEVLKLDYSPISIAKGLVFYSSTILFTPVMGRLHGSGNPTKFCGYLFLSLISYPIFMICIKIFGIDMKLLSPEILLYITFFFFGIFMSGVTMSWNLSSIYYSPPNEVANYQAVHITLTGVRGLIAPFIGYLILKYISIYATFLVSSGFFLLAGIMMLKESRRKS